MFNFDIEVLPTTKSLLIELERVRTRQASLVDDNAGLRAKVAELTNSLKERMTTEQWEIQLQKHQQELATWQAKHASLFAVSYTQDHSCLQAEVESLRSQVETYHQKVLSLEKQLFILPNKSRLLQNDVVKGIIDFLDFNSLTKLAMTSKSALRTLGGQVGTWKLMLANAVEVSWKTPVIEEMGADEPGMKSLIDK